MLKCVPFDASWTGSETKLDLRAIYLRRKEDNWGNPILDANGQEQWDTTTGLPMRRHNDYMRKGYKYLTLADEESLRAVAPYLAQQGEDWRTYMQDMRTRSPFSVEKYLAGVAQDAAADLKELIELVREFGAEAVTKIKQKDDPKWQMPQAVLEAVTAPTPTKGKAA